MTSLFAPRALRSRFHFVCAAVLGAVCALAGSISTAAETKAADFALKDGDRVVFYGDSITEQNLYNTFAETFVLTRFPALKISFIQSGWGGDSVRGGGGGPIDLRLDCDVIAYKPTVLTVMLGMNDGRYRAFDQEIFDTYARGYRHIIEKVKAALPDVRGYLIRPSSYDDVTRAPQFEGGYNAVLIKYGDFVQDLARENQMTAVDLNAPVVAALTKAAATDPALAQRLIPDRVHPDASGHLIMATALLRAWNAPSLVSSVAVDTATGKVVESANTQVTEVAPDGLTWKQLDAALPFPVSLASPLIALADRSGGVNEQLNQEMLRVAGLKPGSYTLKIDGDTLRNFTDVQLAAGVNLAILSTPMQHQAEAVHLLTLKHNRFHYIRWHWAQVGLNEIATEPVTKLQGDLIKEIDAAEADLVVKQRAAAQPVVHRYELVTAATKAAG